jgi:hypothetical protein
MYMLVMVSKGSVEISKLDKCIGLMTGTPVFI